MQIKLTIKGQKLAICQETIAEQTIDYLEAEATFSNEWNGLTKFVHFTKGEENYVIMLENDKITKDMHLNLSKGEWIVSLHGNQIVEGEVVERITTTVAQLYVKSTGNLNGEIMPDIPPTVAEQILGVAEQALDISKEALESVPSEVETYVQEHKSELKGDKGDKGDKGEQGIQGPQGEQGKQGPAGSQGPQGIQGKDGKDGQEGPIGPKGEDGKTPVKGVDYFTPQDISEIEQEVQDKINVPTKTSQLENDSNFVNESQLDEVQDIAETAEQIAKGKTKGYVFDTKADMESWIPQHTSELNLGDNLYIIAKDVPDYWWDGTQAQELETQKVDLANYVKNTDYASNTKSGVLKVNGNYGLYLNSNGFIYAITRSYNEYKTSDNSHAISKGTLENVLEGRSEEWTFTLEDGSIITKKAVLA